MAFSLNMAIWQFMFFLVVAGSGLQAFSADYGWTVPLRPRRALMALAAACVVPIRASAQLQPLQPSICSDFPDFFREVHTAEATCLIRQLLTPDLAVRLKSAASIKAFPRERGRK